MITAEVLQTKKSSWIVLRLFFKSDDFAIFEACSVPAVQTSQGLYSGLASNVDVSVVVLIVFGGSGSKVTCLFAEIGIPSKAYATDGKQNKLAYYFFKVYEHNLIVVVLTNSRLRYLALFLISNRSHSQHILDVLCMLQKRVLLFNRFDRTL